MTSWLLVNEEGLGLGKLNVVPTVLLAGQRLSCEEYLFVVPDGVGSFLMNHQTAEGTAIEGITRTGGRFFTISIVGSKVEDVQFLRRRMLRRLGVQDLSSFHLPKALGGAWKRFLWLIRWIRTGQQ